MCSLDELKSILYDCGFHDTDFNMTPKELGMDSLDVLDIISRVEKIYGIQVTENEYIFLQNNTIEKWIEFINDKIKYNGN